MIFQVESECFTWKLLRFWLELLLNGNQLAKGKDLCDLWFNGQLAALVATHDEPR